MKKTFLIEKETELVFQQGDTGSIQFVVDEKLNVSELSDVSVIFHVFRGSSLVMKKEADDWTITGQNLTTELKAEDTKELFGGFRWGIRIIHSEGIHTVGRGPLTINRKPLVIT